MAKKFPHLSDSTDFPNVENVNVYQFANELDYKRYDNKQMQITLCSVPWDVGNVHVGNSIIPGLGNVVYFDGGEEERDEYLDGLAAKVTFATKYRRFHSDDSIRVPVPFDAAINYSYCIVDYLPAPGAEPYIEGEGESNAVTRWLYFVRRVNKASAVNTCELELILDVWQTFIYRVQIPYMMLEQGHAPLSKISADDYLANPIDGTRWLMAPEEVAPRGEAGVSATTLDHVLNSDCVLCLQSTGNPWSGSWSNAVPCAAMASNNYAPSFSLAAVDTENASALLSWIDANVPQYRETVRACFFVPRSYLGLTSTSTFCGGTPGVTVYKVSAGAHVTHNFGTLSKAQFGYALDYADLAKLYTYPYAHLIITDGMGGNYEIRIEDTDNNGLSLESAVSVVGGALAIVGHVNGVGGGKSATLKFEKLGTSDLIRRGKWHDYLMQWDIDTYAIYQSPALVGDYSTHFDRIQAKLAADNAKSSAAANATARLNNENASADLAYNNANLDASNRTSNAALTVAGNSSINSTSNSAASTDTRLTNAYNVAINAWSIGYTNTTTNNEVNAEYASAAIGAAGGTAGAVASGAMSGGLAGAVGGLISGAISGATEIAQASVAANLTSSQASAANAYADAKLGETNTNASDRTANQISANTSNTNTSNSVTSGIAANDAATTRNQGSNSQSTGKANATRSYNAAVTSYDNDYSTAINAISNGLSQRGLDVPAIFAEPNVNARSVLQPQLCELQVITQSSGFIAMAGDEFLRHGYRYDGQWEFTGWNVQPKFSYWKCSDIWVKSLSIPDANMDEIRYLLLGGVTVWRKPEYIGNTSIYENN